MVKIKGTRDYIDVYIDDKVVRIPGEMVHGGFIAEKGGIRVWKEPEGKPITAEEREEIMKSVIDKTSGSHMVITFE
ncbi:MAG: hypothetical protein J6W10_10430 [Kiritimatiellae bacterium]|nr:hypothetical protein [Kiritimatiellia bacterium]